VANIIDRFLDPENIVAGTKIFVLASLEVEI
jgi:hypothetical protein